MFLLYIVYLYICIDAEIRRKSLNLSTSFSPISVRRCISTIVGASRAQIGIDTISMRDQQIFPNLLNLPNSYQNVRLPHTFRHLCRKLTLPR